MKENGLGLFREMAAQARVKALHTNDLVSNIFSTNYKSPVTTCKQGMIEARDVHSKIQQGKTGFYGGFLKVMSRTTLYGV